MKIGVRSLKRASVISIAAVALGLTVMVAPVLAGSPPSVTSFTPLSGAPGTQVSVTGGGFLGGTGVSSVAFDGTPATFNVTDDQHLTTTVPNGATTGKIAVTTSEGTGTSAANFMVTKIPTITGFSPSSGIPGTMVTINGDNFTGVSAVRFNGIATTFNFASDAKVTATVPAGATTGRISLTTPSGTATSPSDFTVGSGNAPTIDTFSPASGVVGTSVTINGNHFTGVNGVNFNGTNASFNFITDNKVKATVPNGATTGKISVTTPAGTATSASNFTVTGTVPTISSFSPASGAIGTTVTIIGDHFTGVNGVRFNGMNANFNFITDNKVKATVPNGATTGKISVTTPAGTATSASNFTVGTGPTISSFSPASGGVGTSVTINGDHFTGVNGVKFNGTIAAFSFVSDNKLKTTVPGGATTGRITIATPAGTGTTSSDFTVTGGGGHGRKVSMKISGKYASGTVSVSDGYSACASNVPVVIKRFRQGEWRWVTTASTKSDGSYKALIGGGAGRYKAKAKKITLVNGVVCGGDQSPIVHH